MDNKIHDSQVNMKVGDADLWWAWAMRRLDLTSKGLCPRVGKEGSGYDGAVVRKSSNHFCGRLGQGRDVKGCRAGILL